MSALITGLLAAGAVGPVSGQGSVVVAGVVRDEGGRGVSGAVVHLETLDRSVATGDNGRFEFEGVVAGQHALEVSAAGFAPRLFRFSLTETQRRVDLGTITLMPSSDPSVRLNGVVTDAQSGEPIPRVPIRVNGRVVALTGDDGRFHVVAGGVDTDGLNRIEARRIGFRPVERDFAFPDRPEALHFDLAMEPTPVGLEGITVEGEEVELSTGRLRDFYRRRALGLGHFFTRNDIRAIGANRVSDVVRRIPGTIVITEENVSADLFGSDPTFSQFPRTTIQFQQRRGSARQQLDRPCSPVVFVNDVQVQNPDFDMLSRARDVAGMEVYTSAAQVPVEYNVLGSACGVIALWIDGRSGQGRLGTGFEVGLQFVGEWDGGFTRGQLGLQLLVPLFQRVELRPAFSLIVDGSRSEGAGWQAMSTVAWHPVPQVWPWYVGMGAAITRSRPSNGGALVPPNSRTSHVMTTGVAFGVGPFRPFVEVQSLGGLTSARRWQTAFGLTIRTSRAPASPFAFGS